MRFFICRLLHRLFGWHYIAYRTEFSGTRISKISFDGEGKPIAKWYDQYTPLPDFKRYSMFWITPKPNADWV